MWKCLRVWHLLLNFLRSNRVAIIDSDLLLTQRSESLLVNPTSPYTLHPTRLLWSRTQKDTSTTWSTTQLPSDVQLMSAWDEPKTQWSKLSCRIIMLGFTLLTTQYQVIKSHCIKWNKRGFCLIETAICLCPSDFWSSNQTVCIKWFLHDLDNVGKQAKCQLAQILYVLDRV